MSNLFYPKLAVTNIKKNGKFYIPYLLTCVGTIAMFYIMCSITYNDGLSGIPHSSELISILRLGSIVIGLFSFIFLMYTNSFLMKRRKKEFGLYNILGMEKRHISKIMFFESTIITLISLSIGLLSGILFGKLIMMALFKFLSFKVTITDSISVTSIIITAILFTGIFIITFLVNLAKIHLANPIELLRGGNTGEKEPRTKLLLAILGFISLGTGYYIAIVTESPIQALLLFFVAVVLVIIGTYCVFTAGSIAILKILRKSKKYYYKTTHFISVSGMLYRMKQNAVGLANICILSTMVLVMISTTVCLYLGVDDGLAKRYPTDVSVEKYYNGFPTEEDKKCVEEMTTEYYKHDLEVNDFAEYTSLSFATLYSDHQFRFDSDESKFYTNTQDMLYLFWVSADEYEKITGDKVSLNPDEVLINTELDELTDTLDILDMKYTIKDRFSRKLGTDDYESVFAGVTYIVVADDEVMERVYSKQLEAYAGNASNMTCHMEFNLSGTNEEKSFYADELTTSLNLAEKYGTFYCFSRQLIRDEFYKLYGGLLFLGIFLGILFMMATVLIIYYKQISEGYEDKERYNVMQKVGMSKNEVKQTIKTQIITVFFLPLIAAAIHVLAAFPMIERLIALFNLSNLGLFMLCTAITVVVFAIVYGIVYALTAKAYYKIVD